MLHSQTCMLGRAASLGQPLPVNQLQRSTSGGLHSIPQPSVLTRCLSGPVHVPAHGSTAWQDVPLAINIQQELLTSVDLPSACVGVTQVRQQCSRQEYQVNFGTAIR